MLAQLRISLAGGFVNIGFAEFDFRLHELRQLTANHSLIAGSLDTDSHGLPLDAKNGDRDIRTDLDRFTELSCENQHVALLCSDELREKPLEELIERNASRVPNGRISFGIVLNTCCARRYVGDGAWTAPSAHTDLQLPM
jgi:hypothetical protein